MLLELLLLDLLLSKQLLLQEHLLLLGLLLELCLLNLGLSLCGRLVNRVLLHLSHHLLLLGLSLALGRRRSDLRGWLRYLYSLAHRHKLLHRRRLVISLKAANLAPLKLVLHLDWNWSLRLKARLERLLRKLGSRSLLVPRNALVLHHMVSRVWRRLLLLRYRALRLRGNCGGRGLS